MTKTTHTKITNMQGDLAMPRDNGELVFTAPWEGRVFGIAVALNENGMYEWGDFQHRLAKETAAAPSGDDTPEYYERWLASLESLLLDKGMITREELDARTIAYETGDLDD